MKTTAKHFKVFKKEVEKWIPKLGLSDFNIDIVHKDYSDGSARAWYWIYYDDLTGGVALTKDWGEDKITNLRLKRCAFHELFHMKMSHIGDMLSERGYSDKEINSETHKIIFTLESVIFGIGE